MSRFTFARLGALLSLSLVLVLAACGGSGAASDGGDATDGGTSGGGTVAVTDGVVTITADALEFDASTIEAPAGVDFTITLVNNDSAPHNVSIYTEEGGDLIGEVGPTANGDETVDTPVAALEAGTYYFQCDIHPEMNGTVVVEG